MIKKTLADYQGLLLDMDGTLVDTEPWHMDAHREALQTWDYAVTDEELIGVIGGSDKEFYQRLFPEAQLADILKLLQLKDDTFFSYYDSRKLVRQPGVDELCDAVDLLSLPCCLVTTSTRKQMELALKSSNLAKRIAQRVCFEETAGHKPDPAPYLLAQEKLAVPGKECLAIEDSVSGVQAAKASGADAVGIAHFVAEKDLYIAGADLVVRSIADIFA